MNPGDDPAGREGVPVERYMTRLDDLLDGIEGLGDPEARAIGLETVETLLRVYGEGLRRILDTGRRVAGEDLIVTLGEDELISHLMLLHDLHPRDASSRVAQALAKLEPDLHGEQVELVDVTAGTARLRVEGTCNGCSASSANLKATVEQKVLDAAPELVGVVIDEGLDDSGSERTIIPLSEIGRRTQTARAG